MFELTDRVGTIWVELVQLLAATLKTIALPFGVRGACARAHARMCASGRSWNYIAYIVT